LWIRDDLSEYSLPEVSSLQKQTAALLPTSNIPATSVSANLISSLHIGEDHLKGLTATSQTIDHPAVDVHPFVIHTTSELMKSHPPSNRVPRRVFFILAVLAQGLMNPHDSYRRTCVHGLIRAAARFTEASAQVTVAAMLRDYVLHLLENFLQTMSAYSLLAAIEVGGEVAEAVQVLKSTNTLPTNKMKALTLLIDFKVSTEARNVALIEDCELDPEEQYSLTQSGSVDLLSLGSISVHTTPKRAVYVDARAREEVDILDLLSAVSTDKKTTPTQLPKPIHAPPTSTQRPEKGIALFPSSSSSSAPSTIIDDLLSFDAPITTKPPTITISSNSRSKSPASEFGSALSSSDAPSPLSSPFPNLKVQANDDLQTSSLGFPDDVFGSTASAATTADTGSSFVNVDPFAVNDSFSVPSNNIHPSTFFASSSSTLPQPTDVFDLPVPDYGVSFPPTRETSDGTDSSGYATNSYPNSHSSTFINLPMFGTSPITSARHIDPPLPAFPSLDTAASSQAHPSDASTGFGVDPVFSSPAFGIGSFDRQSANQQAASRQATTTRALPKLPAPSQPSIQPRRAQRAKDQKPAAYIHPDLLDL
jgi:hypothetical protein